MTIYFVVRYIHFKKASDLYFIGSSIGLLLLSKYTGIVLLIALFFFILTVPQYRSLLRNKHFYFSLLLAALISSPIFIWNYQHNWVSLFYQLHSHHTANTLHEFISYIGNIVTRYNILLFLLIYVFIRSFNQIKQQDSILLLFYISFVFVLFFLYQSLNNGISKHLLTPFCISSTLLCSYYISQYRLRKIYLFTIVLYCSSTVYYLTSYSFSQNNVDGNMAAYKLAKVAGEKYCKTDTIVVTSFWETAAQMLFWLPGKPQIYTLPCGSENQYAFWSQPIVQQIKENKIKEVLYLDFDDKSMCIAKHFAHCEALPTLYYENPHFRFHEKNKKKLFAYRCTS
jgi:4-amino-4-deoxy-L-arabinose transferase-like glycosyltransferase